MDAITETESGGDHDARGRSGEIGALQMLPATWRAWSRDVLGYQPTLTTTNQRYVAAHIVERWIREGLTDRQIAWRYNSGRHTGCSSGVNRHGVEYDSCAYATRLLANLAQ